jgi:hypothetical protein
MKLLLLKSLLQRRARDEGFTLPMVIALGLVMLLLGTINIVKSSEENISAISQNSSSDALAVAEVGVTKYRELLNQNRILTVYNHDQWTTNANVTGQTCNNMTTTPAGWKDGGTAAAPNSTTKWWELKENTDGVAGDETIGEYRLVSYEHDRDNLSIAKDEDNNGSLDDTTASDENGIFSLFSDADVEDDSEPGPLPHSITDENDTDDDGESDAVGILTVQGRSPDGTSVAQIEVEIPLRINDLESFAPVLWVGSGAIANTGTINMSSSDDNIVLRNAGAECPSPTVPGTTNVTSNAFTEPRSLPAIDTPPTDTTKKNTVGAMDTSGSRLLLPRTGTSDNQDANERFLYEVTTINVAANDLVTDGIAKVALYASNNITIDGAAGTTRTIGNSNAANAGGSFANFNAGSTTNTSVSSQNLEIYVSGNQTITINTNGGTVNIEAFIHAPDATLNITGNGTVNINGAVWVNNFNNSGTATVNIGSDKTDIKTGAEPSYKFYTTSATMSPRPLTSTPTNWVREEVQ